MSAEDKAKLDGIEAGAEVNPGEATDETAGLMSADDKVKLAGVLPKSGGAMTATLTNPAAAQVRNIQYGTADMTAGTSALTTGQVYFVYE
jgi:hypothetical protein